MRTPTLRANETPSTSLTGYDLASHHRPNVNLSSRTRALKRPKHDQPVDPAEDDASYANPGPLPFPKAFATSDGSSLKLFFELRAPGTVRPIRSNMMRQLIASRASSIR
jgi:hypothetical protein